MRIQKFRKKPVVIEAMRFSGYTMGLPPKPWDPDGGELWQWLNAHNQVLRMDQVDPGPAFALIPTLEGTMRADIGDWIIRGVQGEFYPIKDSIFRETYEAVSDAAQ